MGIRIVVGLAGGTEPGQVVERLLEAGADDVLPPRVELPGVLVALFPDAVGSREAAARAGRLEGVAYAEPDVLRSG
ncbi:hypothetical protein AB0395_26210 [Streptosporangium sp. NPDC051023]|uniref:hypothetical protein n=1 Tax=Streptosporangium sp. NPDC051023 TaxID=3155410 RepID=UPI00344BD292